LSARQSADYSRPVIRILLCGLLLLLLLPSAAMAQGYIDTVPLRSPRRELEKPSVPARRNFLDAFPLRQQTKYFDFRFRRNSQLIGEIGQFLDAFIGIVGRDFFKADFDYPIRVLVLEDRSAMGEFLRSEFHYNDPPGFGVYFSAHKLFVTYESSGLGTFTHEIMHPLVQRNLADCPVWASEGIPAFFEKFYGYWTNQEPVVYWGFQNPWRIDSLGTNLVHLALKRILSTTRSQGDYNECDLRMVSMFLWEQGKFKRFLQLIAKRDKHGYNSYFEAALEMPVERAEPLWRAYLDDVVARRREILLLPPSAIFGDESIFRNFASFHNLLAQPAKPQL
jgi:hypothetical protein